MAMNNDNQGYGNDIGHGFHKSSLRKEEIENLGNRTDITPEEKQRRRHKLEEEVAAGAVGGGILAYAGFHHHQHKEGKKAEKAEAKAEGKHHHFI